MRKSVVLLLVIFILTAPCSIVVKPVFAPSVIENSWATMEPMPQVDALRAAVVNGKIYAIGGVVNYEYDPVANSWTAKKPMPTARQYFGIAVYQNKIYTIGGSWWDSDIGRVQSNANEVYDPLTDTWETMEPMPTNRSGLNANFVKGKIYLMGGRTVGPQYLTVALNEVYDPATNSWTTKEPMLYPVVAYASAAVDDKIYIIGGQDEFNSPINLVKNVAGIGLSGDCDRGAFENVLVYARRWSQALLYLYSANLIILSSYTVFLEEEVRWNEMWSLWC